MMSTIQSIELANNMKMHGIAESLERRLAQHSANPGDSSELIRLLLEDEKLSRDNKKASRLVTRAKFRRSCQLEDWDQSFERGISKAQLKELRLLNFYHNRENLILVGGTGSGKTHLAIALGHKLCLEGFSTSFYSTNLLLEEVASQKASGRYLSFIRGLSKTSVLIFDDFGLRSYDHDEAMIFMDIIEDRYRKGALILTSQVKPEGWLTLFEDKITAEALIDRLSNPSTIITMKGGSYREKHQQNLGDKKVHSAKSKK
jgi:DNA replication protein DnaC